MGRRGGGSTSVGLKREECCGAAVQTEGLAGQWMPQLNRARPKHLPLPPPFLCDPASTLGQSFTLKHPLPIASAVCTMADAPHPRPTLTLV